MSSRDTNSVRHCVGQMIVQIIRLLDDWAGVNIGVRILSHNLSLDGCLDSGWCNLKSSQAGSIRLMTSTNQMHLDFTYFCSSFGFHFQVEVNSMIFARTINILRGTNFEFCCQLKPVIAELGTWNHHVRADVHTVKCELNNRR